MVTLPLQDSIEGYVDQPAATDAVCAEAARLREAGAARIHYETDAERRPVLRELVDTAGSDTVLLIVALDRLGRSLGRVLESLSRFRAAGVRVRSLEGGVDINMTPEGWAQARVVDALSRCVEGWEARRAQHWGDTMTKRGRRPGATPKLANASPDQVRAMLARPGASHGSVARELGVGRTTLYRFLNQLRLREHGPDDRQESGQPASGTTL